MFPQRPDALHRTTLRGLEGRGGEPNPGPALIALLWTCLLLPDRRLQLRDSTAGSNCTRGFRVLGAWRRSLAPHRVSKHRRR